MARVVVSGEALVELRGALERMSSMVRAEEVPLDELGKSLAAIAIATRAAFVASRVSSVRMDAVVKALDLRSKKSELEAFVGAVPTRSG